MNHVAKRRPMDVVLIVSLTLLVLANIVLISINKVLPLYLQNWKHYEIYGGINEELKDSELFEDLQSGKTICFMGDSITAGSCTNGIHWYHPLIPYIVGNHSELSHGGWTVADLISQEQSIPTADVYVVAIGVNDILCVSADPSRNEDEFISRISTLTQLITDSSPNARIYYISPWPLYVEDAVRTRRDVFCNALRDWCDTSGCIYIDSDPYIVPVIDENEPERFIMGDGIHPTAPDGVGLYSYGVLMAEHCRRSGNA